MFLYIFSITHIFSHQLELERDLDLEEEATLDLDEESSNL